MPGVVEHLGNLSLLGIRKKGSGILLGGVDVRDIGNYEVNLSYVVFPQFRREGNAHGAALLALAYAAKFMGARAAVIKMLSENLASAGLARKLGAVSVGDEPSDVGGTFNVFTLPLH
jgi:RimJ/RimL family protein N-acetyltransferase